MKKHILIFLALLIMIACEKDDQIESIADDKLIELAYDKDYFYPDGFYYEKNLIGSTYYENTISIKPTGERENIWIELNTTEKTQAKTWSDLSNEYSSVNRPITQENETEKYFEFKRVNIENDNDILLSRIHKTSYFICQHNRFTNIDTVGIYKGELNATEVKEFIEYLWSCGTLGVYDKVVKSEISDNVNHFKHYIQSLRLVYGDWGLHDMISVYDYSFLLDKSNGLLTVEFEKTKEIQGNYNEGW